MRSLHLFVYSFRRCHPSLLCRIHPLPRVPWMWKVKNRIMFYLHSTKMFMSCWIQVQRMDTVPFEVLSTWRQLFASMWQHLVDSCLLLRRPKEQKVIQNMTHPSIIFHTSDWGGIFLKKIGNIFLHYLVAFSSCDTRFEEEKWELSQLEYSGETQLLQRDFEMGKTYVDGF